MKILMCSCRHCKRGRGSGYANAVIKRAKRHFRTTVRRKLHIGDYDNVPVAVGGIYTD